MFPWMQPTMGGNLSLLSMMMGSGAPTAQQGQQANPYGGFASMFGLGPPQQGQPQQSQQPQGRPQQRPQQLPSYGWTPPSWMQSLRGANQQPQNPSFDPRMLQMGMMGLGMMQPSPPARGQAQMFYNPRPF